VKAWGQLPPAGCGRTPSAPVPVVGPLLPPLIGGVQQLFQPHDRWRSPQFRNFAPEIYFSQNFYYILNFHKYFKNEK